MTDIDTIKQLYTPTSTAETQAVISSVSEQEKKQKKETAAFGEILKNVSSLATKIGKDVKSFKLAKEGGFGEGTCRCCQLRYAGSDGDECGRGAA